MAKIKAFRGLRPRKGLEQKIASLPYDVMNSREAREVAKGDDYTFLHIVKPEIDLPQNISLYDDAVYNTAKNNLQKFIKNEWLIQDNTNCLYIYKQKMGDHEQYGLVAAASCDDYDNNIIKKHEFTRKEKEDDRARHVYETNCNAGPVFLTYKEKKSIDEIISNYTQNQPTYDFVASDGISHTLWIIDDIDIINELVHQFQNVEYLYVADGHHRAASGSRTRKIRQIENNNHTGDEEYNFFLTVLFPGNQLKILPYNRAVKDLNGLNTKLFIEKLSSSFDISETDIKEPSKPGSFCMYLDKKWYSLRIKSNCISDDPVKKLDVSILQDNILSKLLNINDPRTDNRVNFIGGIRGTKELENIVNDGTFKVAFSMFPTKVSDIIDIADAGKVMPPKSTWFEPKLRSGLVVHLLD